MTDQLEIQFDMRFLDKHAGAIVQDPLTAIVELLANAWDAGATKVEVMWPTADQPFSITDNGTGMTPQEFRLRWRTIDYNRRANQGTKAQFPLGVKLPPRPAYGRNGRGRHASLCFADSYTVITTKGGIMSSWQVQRGLDAPLVITPLGEEESRGTGTEITADKAEVPSLSSADARTEIGLRFLTDPNFEVHFDGQVIKFDDLPNSQVNREEIEVEGVGTVVVLMVDAQQADRTTKQHGIAWRVENRLVGECSWSDFGDSRFLDGRRKAAKRFTYIVFADVLEDAVLADWTGFDEKNAAWRSVRENVHGHIRNMLLAFTEEDRKDVAERARQRHHSTVKKLTPGKREVWNEFVDRVQKECPSLTAQQVIDLAGVLANLEVANSQYGLIAKLRQMETADLDTLHDMLDQWTLDMAKVVLDEVAGRLLLIDQLTEKVNDKTAHEVQELQPLFKQGLWIFGPEFEAVEFTSNQGMTTVVQTLFDAPKSERGTLNRPDFVVRPDSTVGLYSYDRFDDETGLETGVSRLIVIELKKLGVRLGEAEKSQGWKYIKELLGKGYIDDRTRVTCFVLGDGIEQGEARPRTEGDRISIAPMLYDTVLRRARSRMFRLYERVKDAPFLDERRRKEWEEFVEGDRTVQRNLDLYL